MLLKVDQNLDGEQVVLEQCWFKYVCKIECKKIKSYYNVFFQPRYEVKVYSYNGLDLDDMKLDSRDNLTLTLKESKGECTSNRMLIWEGSMTEGKYVSLELN